mgnify:CR=1 FL=1
MEEFVRGDIVIVPFPFTDLTKLKRRPSLVLAKVKEDVILCQVTSKLNNDPLGIFLENEDTILRSLIASSMVKPYKIFTLKESLVDYKIDQLSKIKIK